MFGSILDGLSTIWDWLQGFIFYLSDTFSWLWDTFNDFILEWGDWLVEQLWYYVWAIVTFIGTYFIWRFLTVIVVGAFASTTLNTFRTGVFLYFLAWITSVILRMLGLGYVAFTASFYAFVPNVGDIIVRGLSLIPAVFQPTVAYLNVHEAIHFMFSVFAFIATYKIGRWVFQRPSLGG